MSGPPPRTPPLRPPPRTPPPSRSQARVSKPRRIVILTGAGISAESGLGTFRDAGGLWSRHDWRDLATPEGFARDPKRRRSRS